MGDSYNRQSDLRIIEVLIRVEGRVQRVGFRAWTHAVASALGVRGWVGNRYDGSVEVHAAATEAVIEELKRRLHSGPRGAFVSRVSVEGPAERLPSEGFEVRR